MCAMLDDKRPAARQYRIKLTGPGLDLETDVTPEQAAHILEVCLTDSRLGRSRTLVEHLNRFDTKENPDKILCFASHIVDVLGCKSIEPEAIKLCYRKCGEPIPRNFPRYFREAILNRWLDELPNDPGRFYITGSGRKALQAKFTVEAMTQAPA